MRVLRAASSRSSHGSRGRAQQNTQPGEIALFDHFTSLDENTWRWYYPLTTLDGTENLATDTDVWDGDPPWDPNGSDQTAGIVRSYRSISGSSLLVKADNVPSNYGGVSFPQTRGLARTISAQKYGRWEIRAKIPQGKGFWPALWLWPLNPEVLANSYEIDIGEWPGTASTTWYTNVHWGPWPNPNQESGPPSTAGDFTDWHVYELSWSASAIRWFLDGVEARAAFTDSSGLSQLTEPLALHLDFQVGSNHFGGMPGNPDGSTPWPGFLEVDWVRISRTPRP
jgi:beta-glucanase (GH16 family)